MIVYALAGVALLAVMGLIAWIISRHDMPITEDEKDDWP